MSSLRIGVGVGQSYVVVDSAVVWLVVGDIHLAVILMILPLLESVGWVWIVASVRWWEVVTIAVAVLLIVVGVVVSRITVAVASTIVAVVIAAAAVTTVAVVPCLVVVWPAVVASVASAHGG